MNILISGGTGFIGSALCTALLKKQHQLIVLTREAKPNGDKQTFITSLDDLKNDTKIDVAINLAGEPIANKRWTDQQKQRIIASRLDTTEAFIDLFKRLTNQPQIFISGSAIGFYGTEIQDDPVDENASGDDSFSSQLCARWEASALQAKMLGIRTCLLRTGIVLGEAGALKKMLAPFKMGLGGKIGSGNQWMPWIHLDDEVRLIQFCIENSAIHGPINCTAPNPATNSQFTNALGNALHRPTLLPMPAVAIKLLMGEMGEELLLCGKRVVPKKALDCGFSFQFSELSAALLDIVANKH